MIFIIILNNLLIFYCDFDGCKASYSKTQQRDQNAGWIQIMQ